VVHRRGLEPPPLQQRPARREEGLLHLPPPPPASPSFLRLHSAPKSRCQYHTNARRDPFTCRRRRRQRHPPSSRALRLHSAPKSHRRQCHSNAKRNPSHAAAAIRETHAHAYTRTRTHAHIHTHTRACIPTHTHARAHTHTHAPHRQASPALATQRVSQLAVAAPLTTI
jgi:hypothetical protein